MRNFARILTALFAVVVLFGCTGDAGPMGPQGEQGIPGLEGLPGPGTRVVLTAIIGDNGRASVYLPTEIGAELPSVAGYTGIGDGGWYAVNDGYWIQESPWFAVVWDGSRWFATMYQGSPGWIAAFVVVY